MSKKNLPLIVATEKMFAETKDNHDLREILKNMEDFFRFLVKGNDCPHYKATANHIKRARWSLQRRMFKNGEITDEKV